MGTEFLSVILKSIMSNNKEQASAALSKYVDAGMKAFVNPPQPIKEHLSADASVKDYIDDFTKSDAPQFKGKSKKKKIDMAVAASYKDKK